MGAFTEALQLKRYAIYMRDHGGPVGFRTALTHPERVDALIVQDAVVHNEGLGENWKARRAFWADRAAPESALRGTCYPSRHAHSTCRRGPRGGTVRSRSVDRRI